MTNNDKAEIINLYAFALDTHQWDLFDRIFTQDVIAVFGPAGAGWNSLTLFKASCAAFHTRLDSHQTFLTLIMASYCFLFRWR